MAEEGRWTEQGGDAQAQPSIPPPNWAMEINSFIRLVRGVVGELASVSLLTPIAYNYRLTLYTVFRTGCNGAI